MTDPSAESGRAIGADAIADALGLPRPTEQQRRVIEAPLAPALVVAGAGSGKTETMANRVLWLLANRLVEPGGILGLTFTRKAAGELGDRIGQRIAGLTAAGLLLDAVGPSDRLDLIDSPTVATYNSFANTLYRENAMLLAREGDGSVLGEAASWQLARSIVVRAVDPRLPELEKGLDAVTGAVLRVARAMSENVVAPEAVRDFVTGFRSVADLPSGGRGAYADVDSMVAAVGSLDVLVELAGEYGSAKIRRGLIEYSDQVALSLSILERDPRVAERLRQQYRVVLLDEYQDTSVVQTRLLARLFAGHPVMAVGDPNQSIYGWRGASAANLDHFSSSFGATGPRYSLSTSWRNGRRILDAANELVVGTAAGVERLDPGPHASDFPVSAVFAETLEEEADAVAGWLQQHLSSAGEPPSAAILFRARRTQAVFLDALRDRGIPYHVLGVGGLLAEPEIADLVSAMTVTHDPSAGLELVRLLAGSRWRIGVRDLEELRSLSSWLRDRDLAQRTYEESVGRALQASVAGDEGGSIVDALDFLGTARPGHSALAGFTGVGLERLRDAAGTFARLRSRTNLDLPDFAAFVLQELQLDIEVAANEFRPLGGASFDALFDAIADFLALDEVATLGGFLSWLREAEAREDLTPRPEDPEPGTVQVLTIHGAKGLEWDVVAVPRMVDDELPAKARSTQGWLAFGELPWPLKGDAAELPRFDWAGAATRKEVVDERARFSEAVKQRGLTEERRLAYVAVTRARHHLMLSGSFWAQQTRPRRPGAFLRELEQAAIVPPLPTEPESDENPAGDRASMFRWPMDPLGSRRERVEAAADAVRAAQPELAGPWRHELELLLEERRRLLGASRTIALPVRVPASRFKDFVDDPASVAAGLRRPMPERPYRATQLGTLFHSWVEGRYGIGGDSAELDSVPSERDTDAEVESDALARLQAIFEASPWASRIPVEVEREIHLPFDGRVIVCKIDAVYEQAGRYEIVDWKTGAAPTSAKDLADKRLQLALYRLAYARWRGIDAGDIDAVFYYVADDRVIRPDHIEDESELLARWRAAFG